MRMQNIIWKMIIAVAVLSMATAQGAQAQRRSWKRGVCWDEKTQLLTAEPVGRLAPGVGWLYNWGLVPQGPPGTLGPETGVEFVPMAWNGGFDEAVLRAYLDAHPGCKYLLGFNEPNFASQANMTPQQAAEAWPRLELVAADYGLRLVAPALNFTGERVGGRVWSPFEWYDEFFRLYPGAQVDCLAMHCYMNWAENVDWIASRYFYSSQGESDLQRSENRQKYPHLVQYMDEYKAREGHFPRMFLTEFCAWETGVYPYAAGLTREFQLDQMSQKLQYLEQSDCVEGYAWFMANPAGGADEFPYMSLFQRNEPQSELSDLGMVYVHMSSFDVDRHYAPGEWIAAKDYVDASLDDIQVRLRPNTDAGSAAPLLVELRRGAWAAYLLDVPSSGEYRLQVRARCDAGATLHVYEDELAGTRQELHLEAGSGEWADTGGVVALQAGRHRLLLRCSGATVALNGLMVTPVEAGIGGVSTADGAEVQHGKGYTTGGRVATGGASGVVVQGGRKVIVR